MKSTTFRFLFKCCFLAFLFLGSNTEAQIFMQNPTYKVASVGQQFRIAVVYLQRFLQSPQTNSFMESVIETQVGYWSQKLTPKSRTRTTLGVSRTCMNNFQAVFRNQMGVPVPYCPQGCALQTMCSTTMIPAEFLAACYELRNGILTKTAAEGMGVVPADYILFIDVNMNRCANRELAYGSVCRLDDYIDRPNVGVINVCPQEIGIQQAAHRQHLVHAALRREMVHALGFHSFAYAFMRDSEGQPRTPRDPTTNLPSLGVRSDNSYIASDSTLQLVNRPWRASNIIQNENIYVLTTPKLLEFARNHYGCPNLMGVPLEDEEEGVIVGSNFEKLIAVNELMVAYQSHVPVTSGLTLSFLDDTGWYTVDLNAAEKWNYGKNLGCDFVTKSCFEYMEKMASVQGSLRPFCGPRDMNISRCLGYENAHGMCDVKLLQIGLPEKHQYFLNNHGLPPGIASQYGSPTPYMNRCPTFMPAMSAARTGYCSKTTTGPNPIQTQMNSMEYYGANSRCFEHVLNSWYRLSTQGLGTSVNLEASCQRSACNAYQMTIFIGSKTLQCPMGGGPMSFTAAKVTYSVTGQLMCPSVPCEPDS